MSEDRSSCGDGAPRPAAPGPEAGAVVLWRVADADDLAARLASVGVDVERGPSEVPGPVGPGGIRKLQDQGGAWIVRLAGGIVVLRSAIGATPRLALGRAGFAGARGESFDPEPGLDHGLPPGDEREPRAALVAIGWGTVDLDRTATTFGAGAGGAGGLPNDAAAGARATPLPSDAGLGARAALLRGPSSPLVLLMEPEREGGLAAALARFGEGPCVLYVGISGAGGPPSPSDGGPRPQSGLRRLTDGPFGRQSLLSGGAPWGPHVVVVAPGSDPAPTLSGPSDGVPSCR